MIMFNKKDSKISLWNSHWEVLCTVGRGVVRSLHFSKWFFCRSSACCVLRDSQHVESYLSLGPHRLNQSITGKQGWCTPVLDRGCFSPSALICLEDLNHPCILIQALMERERCKYPDPPHLTPNKGGLLSFDICDLNPDLTFDSWYSAPFYSAFYLRSYFGLRSKFSTPKPVFQHVLWSLSLLFFLSFPNESLFSQ